MKIGPYVSTDDLPDINIVDTTLYDLNEDEQKDSNGQLVGPED